MSNNTPVTPLPEDPIFIGIPGKTTEDVDWTRQLGVWMEEACEESAQAATSQWAAEIAKLNRMRQDARGAEASLGGRDLIIRYYGQLEFLAKRFPCQRPLTQLEFTWNDAFDNTQIVKQTSLAFEKCNWLFNLAALLSRHASQLRENSSPKLSGEDLSDINSNGAISQAALHFQSSACILNWIADNFLHPPLTDIQRPCLTFLSACMQAQAQECVAWRALREGKSKALLAKLWAGTASLYTDALARFDQPSAQFMRSIMQRGHQTRSLLQTKHAYFEAGANLLYSGVRMEQAEQHAVSGAWGEAIGRLHHAQSILSEVEKSWSEDQGYSAITSFFTGPSNTGASSPVLEQVKRLLGRVRAVHGQAMRENDLIYHEQPTPPSTLAALESTILVRVQAKSLYEAWSGGDRPAEHEHFRNNIGCDLFERLIPLQALSVASEYSERLAGLIRLEAQRVNEAESAWQECLNSLGFPAALEQLSSRGEHSLPEELQLLKQQAKQQCNLDVSTICNPLRMLAVSLNGLDRALGDEIELWEQGRRAHQSSWVQEASEKGNATFFARLAGLKAETSRVEKEWQNRWQEYEKDAKSAFSLLRDGREADLVESLTRSTLIDQGSNSVDGGEGLKRIQSLLDKIEHFSRERLANLEKLKREITTKNIADKDLLMDREMAKHDALCKVIEDSCKMQRGLLEEFKEAWNGARRQQQSIWLVESGQLMIRQLTTAYSLHVHLVGEESKLKMQLAELQAYGKQLEGEVNSWLEQRQRERQRLEASIKEQSILKSQELLRQRLESLKNETSEVKNEVDTRSRASSLLARLSNSASKEQLGDNNNPPTIEPSLLD